MSLFEYRTKSKVDEFNDFDARYCVIAFFSIGNITNVKVNVSNPSIAINIHVTLGILAELKEHYTSNSTLQSYPGRVPHTDS